MDASTSEIALALLITLLSPRVPSQSRATVERQAGGVSDGDALNAIGQRDEPDGDDRNARFRSAPPTRTRVGPNRQGCDDHAGAQATGSGT